MTLVLFDELTYRLGKLLIGKEPHPRNRAFEVTAHGCVSPRDLIRKPEAPVPLRGGSELRLLLGGSPHQPAAAGERQSDLLLSTLRAYLTALGAEASLVVSVGGKTIAQGLTEGKRR
jgi:hypothetical protein